jgi:hypothetical protein
MSHNSERCASTLRLFRFAVLPFIACGVVAGACGGTRPEAGAPPESALCVGFERLAVELADASKDEGFRATRDLLGDDVPAELVDAVSVLDDATSSSDERDRAIGKVGDWFLVECGGPGGGDVRLVPTQVPDGLVLCGAFDMPAVEPETDGSTPTIWGDASLDDPWAGPLVGIWTMEVDELYGHDDAEAITVHGVSGTVAPMPLFQAVSSREWGHIVTWRDSAGLVFEVAARGASPTDAVRIAELVTFGDGAPPSLPADALGPETAPIYEGRGLGAYGSGGTGGWMLQYRPRTLENAEGTEDLRLVMITGSPGVPDDLHTLRFWSVTTKPFEVRNQDGLEYAAFDAAEGPFGIAWQEAPGVIVQVLGLGLDEQTVRNLTGSLEETDADEWRKMKQDAIGAACS